MGVEDIFDVASQAIWLVIKLGGPVMFVGLVIGLILALFQALTQIQEMTLTFVPKILAVFATFYFMAPYMGSELIEFTNQIADTIIGLE